MITRSLKVLFFFFFFVQFNDYNDHQLQPSGCWIAKHQHLLWPDNHRVISCPVTRNHLRYFLIIFPNWYTSSQIACCNLAQTFVRNLSDGMLSAINSLVLDIEIQIPRTQPSQSRSNVGVKTCCNTARRSDGINCIAWRSGIYGMRTTTIICSSKTGWSRNSGGKRYNSSKMWKWELLAVLATRYGNLILQQNTSLMTVVVRTSRSILVSVFQGNPKSFL